jgi:hypothetical protein
MLRRMSCRIKKIAILEYFQLVSSLLLLPTARRKRANDRCSVEKEGEFHYTSIFLSEANETLQDQSKRDKRKKDHPSSNLATAAWSLSFPGRNIIHPSIQSTTTRTPARPKSASHKHFPTLNRSESRSKGCHRDCSPSNACTRA